MSSFKRGARMRVGGRIGRLDRTRLPMPTPLSPPPQEWESLDDFDEEDPEELVPDLSEDEQLDEQHEEQLEEKPQLPPVAPPQEQQ